MTQRQRKKIAKKKERLRQAEKINLEDVCGGNYCSLMYGEGKKMINETKEPDL